MYSIAIPSYKRSQICNNKTLKMLNDLGIDKARINVFVIEEEYEDYKQVLIPTYYNEIVVGVKGLVQQRQFISIFYPENTNIIYIDDDITELDLSLTDYKTADDLFTDAFRICKIENAYIWGLYPVYNPFFRKERKGITTDLSFIIGAFYGIINRQNHSSLKLKLTIDGNKEDVERSILYYKLDGKVIRFNRVGFKTKYYGSDGGGLGTFKDRLDVMKNDALIINAEYPNITKIKIRKNGMYEIVLKPEKNKKKEVFVLPHLEPDDYCDLINLLQETNIPLLSNKMGRAKTFGTHRGCVLGFVKSRITRTMQLSYFSKKKNELYNEVVKLGKKICPFDFTTIQLNHNVVCPRHLDSNNKGLSLLVSFGDYEGCNIIVEGNGEYDTNCQPIIFDGSKLYHYNTPLIKGNKYSLVFFS